MREVLDLWRQVVTNLTLNHEQALLEAQNDTQTLLLLDPGSLPLEKSRPSRAFIVFTVAAAVGAGSWIARNRAAITQPNPCQGVRNMTVQTRTAALAPAAELMEKFKDRTARVGVVGLGYVGLPFAVEKAKVGFRVLGLRPHRRTGSRR